jgi:hypothetical protein
MAAAQAETIARWAWPIRSSAFPRGHVQEQSRPREYTPPILLADFRACRNAEAPSLHSRPRGHTPPPPLSFPVCENAGTHPDPTVAPLFFRNCFRDCRNAEAAWAQKQKAWELLSTCAAKLDGVSGPLSRGGEARICSQFARRSPSNPSCNFPITGTPRRSRRSKRRGSYSQPAPPNSTA